MKLPKDLYEELKQIKEWYEKGDMEKSEYLIAKEAIEEEAEERRDYYS